MLLQRLHQLGIACIRFPRLGHQQALDLDGDAGPGGSGLGNDAAHGGFDFDRVFLGNHAAVKLEHDLAGHHVGVGAAFNAADIEVRMLDAVEA